MNISDAIDFIIELEGGDTLIEDPKDKGGLTKFGISQNAFPNEDIRNLTREKARAIYKEFYWDKLMCGHLPVGLSTLVFDCAVNQGAPTAALFLQRLAKVKPDGLIGPVTLEGLQGMNPQDLIYQYAVLRHERYIKTEGWDRFGKGWSARLLRVALMSAFFTKTHLLG